MTGAIVRLLITGNFTVYFETGLGTLDPLEPLQESISELNNALRENGFTTNALSLEQIAADGGRIPNNASALILARPRRDLTATETAVIADYMARGGGLLIFSDAQLGDNPFLGANSALNQYLWDTFGIRAGSSIIVDPPFSVQTALDLTVAAVYTDTPLGSGLDQRTMPTLLRIVRAVDVNDTPPPNISNGRVVSSSPDSYGETNWQALFQTNTYQYDEGQDIRGPLTFEAWAFSHQTQARVVLFGDSDFVTNGFMTRASGNSVLLLAAVSWVTRYSDEIFFQPVTGSIAPTIFATGANLDLIAFITAIFMPGVVLALGLYIWRKRVSGR